MALEVFEMLRGLFRDSGPGDDAIAKVSEAIERFAEGSRSLREEISSALERLSDDVNRCLEHRLLHSEWEERSRQAMALDPEDRSGLVRQARERSALHAARLEEYRSSANRQETVVRALEQRLLEIDRGLERILRDRDILRTTGGLASSRERLLAVLEDLRRTTGIEFMEALDTIKRQSEAELTLAEARERLDSDDRDGGT
ncbi:MAG: hypothetical protein HY303_11995 [Candidatus Wallbacteria bacterium]|nr:hypothetical protein [Candidatus Wallbacteria bacterium]